MVVIVVVIVVVVSSDESLRFYSNYVFAVTKETKVVRSACLRNPDELVTIEKWNKTLDRVVLFILIAGSARPLSITRWPIYFSTCVFPPGLRH